MFNRNLTTGKRGEEVDLKFDYEIVFVALEPFVSFLFYNDYDITRLSTWRLIAFACKGDCLTALHALVYVNL